MKKVNSFVRGNLTKIYLGFMLLFWVLIMASCEKQPIEPFQLPTAVDPTEIGGEWNITKFYMLEEGFRLDVSAWVDTIANFDLIYGTRAEGYPSTMRWGDNHNSLLQDSSTLGWNWRAEKPLCNVTPFEYLYVPANYFLGLDNEEWITTYKTTNKWVLEHVRRYDNEIELTGEHYQYRELTLER